MKNSNIKDRKIKIALTLTSVVLAVALVLSVVFLGNTVSHLQANQTSNLFDSSVKNQNALNYNKNYQLEQMLIISRHNIRSPLSGGDSILGQVTPNDWFNWTSNPGELSVKGGQMETAMGQFFRKYLENQKLIPENWEPKDGEIRFYTNSLQRTVATAKYFASGMMPVANVTIEHHKKIGESDSFFCPVIRECSPEFESRVRSEINAWGNGEGMKGIGKSLEEPYRLLEKAIDFKDSKYAKENNITQIPTDDINIEIKEGEEIKVNGGLSIANSAVDALKLQIYEENNLNNSLFGHKFSAEELQTMCKAGDVYQKVCEGSKTLAQQVMSPMMTEIKKELYTDGRKFTFFCGHDSTIAALTAALDIKEYALPNTISQKTPIGVKMVFSKYRGTDGKEYIKINMCYNTTDQLRNSVVTSLQNPPQFYGLELNGIKQNADGYYLYDDVISRINQSITYYENKSYKKAS